MNHRAFTLVETMAVVLLLGLLACAAGWSMLGFSRHASMEDVIGRINRLDRLARLAARRTSGPPVLICDLDRQRISRAGEPGGHAVEVADPIAITEVRVLTSGGEERRSAGEVHLPLSPAGRSATYAIALRIDRDHDSAATGGGSRWLVFAGLTGQMVTTHDEATVDNLFATLGAGPDAR